MTLYANCAIIVNTMDIIKLKSLVKGGLSIRQIAQNFNYSATNVRYWLKKYGLVTTPVRPYKCACGETNPEKFYGHKKQICGKCHNKYTLMVGQKKRERAIEYLGRQCVNCKYEKFTCSLDIHHTKPNKKDPNFSSMRGWSWNRILNELKHCILLCRNCHAAVHAGHIEL